MTYTKAYIDNAQQLFTIDYKILHTIDPLKQENSVALHIILRLVES